MLIKIQNIEDECADLEDEVEELKRRINRTLKDERADKERASDKHAEDVEIISQVNQRISE
eukprot:CAMPEP_0170495092 /NCGR_PEP_ID=MMETSP0208-20121228/15011_1 /TAXON_ID=197538 /ORGANISM="Strombidium inclinatum, Strain S3" /LENGTH=60 /DNA_ID=CAMNT_0010771233 /DNA_START=549 /DNA_END=728 /DNA_ORIENTATION=-